MLMELDKPQILRGLTGYLAFTFFDPEPYPNLMASLPSSAIGRRAPAAIPGRRPAANPTQT